jgi:2-oxoglutarate dehydrogenase E2 component (dihydrolipoamide succinyltransferase)
MTVEIKVPPLGESVTEATVAKWFKQAGDAVARDEALVELETDKVALEVNAPEAGVLDEIVAAAGATVNVGGLLGRIVAGKAGAQAQPAAKPGAKPAAVPAPAPVAKPAAPPSAPAPSGHQAMPPTTPGAMPSAAKLLAENQLDAGQVAGTGKGGRVTKGDVLELLEKAGSAAPAAAAPAATKTPDRPTGPREERVRMSRLRRVIASRLKEAQNSAALLTTFNEVDMSALNSLRKDYGEAFEKRHGVRVGFMSFFAKACIAALKEYPAVNAEIDGEDAVYKNYYNIGVAVSTPQGLVVPVVRDADLLSIAGIEKAIGDLGRRGRDGKLGLDDLQGGTFTISNGGVFGSLLSTPIVNPPQSAILGMHKVQDRPVAMEGKVEIRPMMYLALTYDHRIIDGREAVSFLVRVKSAIEDPQRLLLDV